VIHRRVKVAKSGKGPRETLLVSFWYHVWMKTASTPETRYAHHGNRLTGWPLPSL
jgi:hypothetical protein